MKFFDKLFGYEEDDTSKENKKVNLVQNPASNNFDDGFSSAYAICKKAADILLDKYNDGEECSAMVHAYVNIGYGKFPSQYNFSVTVGNECVGKTIIYSNSYDLEKQFAGRIAMDTYGKYISDSIGTVRLSEESKKIILSKKISKLKNNTDVKHWCEQYIFSEGKPQNIFIDGRCIFWGNEYDRFDHKHEIVFTDFNYPTICGDVQLQAIVQTINEFSGNYYTIKNDYDSRGTYQLRHYEKKQMKSW